MTTLFLAFLIWHQKFPQAQAGLEQLLASHRTRKTLGKSTYPAEEHQFLLIRGRGVLHHLAPHPKGFFPRSLSLSLLDVTYLKPALERRSRS